MFNKTLKKIFVTTAIGLLITTSNISEASAQTEKELDYRLKKLESQIADLTQNNKELSKKAAYSSSPLQIAFESAKLSGRLHADFKWYDDDSAVDNQSDGIDIRRVRLGVAGKLADNFYYKFENDFANDASSIKDAKIIYTGIDNVELTIGQSKPEISIQLLDSSNTIPFIERSVAIGDVPERHVGFNSRVYGKNWQIGLGAFGEGTGNESRSDDSAYLFAGRASYAPVNSDEALIHLAVGSSYRSADRGYNVATATTEAVDTETLVDYEIALRYKSFLIQSEYITNNSSYDSDGTAGNSAFGQNGNFESYYVEASLFLTGEHKPYKAKGGNFGAIKLKSADVTNGGTGAWELAVRVSGHDKNNGVIALGKTDAYSLGVNWHLNNNIRLMLNYSDTQTDYADVSGLDNTGYKTYVFRTQVNF
jgi:phosphate-selective porin OprO/OprP